MKKRLLLLLLVLLLLPSCAKQPQASDPLPADGALAEPFSLTFTDAEGTAVTLKERPARVAVLFSSFADVWVTAGGSVNITVGESVERGFAAPDAVLVDSGAGHTTIDLETLFAAAPDLVIGTADYPCQSEAVAACRAAGIPAAVFRVESFSDYLQMLRICCDITGDAERYATYGTAVQERIHALLARVGAGAGAAPRILFVRAGSSARSTKAKTSADHFAAAMLGELGAVNIADSESSLTGTLSLEVIVREDPDYLFITTMGSEEAAKSYMNAQLAAEGWRELACVQSGHYTYLEKDLFHFKPNARWAEAYEALAALLYPEAVQ